MHADRTIRRLRITAADRSAGWRAQTALEDALRTASLGDDARWYCLRRLDLGRLPDRIVPHQLANLLEARVAALQHQAVRGDTQEAAHADCVVFADASVALAHVAQALARDQPPAWFWPHVAPGLSADVPVSDKLLALLQHTLQFPNGAPRAAAILRAVLDTGAGERLFAALSPELGAALLHQSECVRTTPGVSMGTPAEPARRTAARWIAQWGDDDARSRWLMACLPRIPPRLQPALSQSGTIQPDTIQSRSALLNSAQPIPPIQTTLPAAFVRAPPTQRPLSSADMASALQPQAAPTPPLFALPAPLCAHAGLMLLVPALSRLGVADWLARHPQPLFSALLADLAARVGSPLDARFADAFAPDGDAVCAPAVLGAWRCLLRRYCRVHAHIGLHDLIVRPGRIVVTPLHLDVFFDPATIDLRIRRAGLDLDPGWVPWLGRVLRFHYRDTGFEGDGHA